MEKVEVNDFFEKEENKIQASLVAQQIDKAMKGKSFKVRDLCSKFNINGRDAVERLRVLEGFGYIKKGVTKNREMTFKVDLSSKYKILWIKEELAMWEKRIAFLKKELEKLEGEENVNNTTN